MWKKCLSEDLKIKLKRIRDGNRLERQRYDNAEKAITDVLLEPNSNHKHSIGKYQAADVLSQFRLFYEILTEHKVVHFVWINDEKYIHDNSKNPDPCYDRFKTLITTNKIPQYIPPSVSEPVFKMDGSWKKSTMIYAKLIDERGRANSNLSMLLDDADTYKIIDVRADQEEVGLEMSLLKLVIKDCDAHGITLTFDLDLRADSKKVDLMIQILTKSDFKIEIEDSDMQLWVR